VFFTDRGC